MLVCLYSHSSFAQLLTLSDTSNGFMVTKIRSFDTTGFITWKCDSIEPNTVNSTLKSYSGLGTFDTLIMVDSVMDSILYMVKNTYHQFHKSILVENAIYNEHVYNGSLLLSNGLIVEGLGDRDTSPDITESSALSIALAELECDTFYWEDDSLEYYLKLDSFEGDTTWYPQGELIFANLDSPYYSMDPLQWKLAWKFEIHSLVPFNSVIVYIDVFTGEVIKLRETSHPATFDSPIYGNGLYIDSKLHNGRHYLWANDGGKNIKTRRKDIGNSWRYYDLKSDVDGDFGSDYPLETQTHYSINRAYSYWNEKFKRAGTDGKNKELRVIIFDHNDTNKDTYYWREDNNKKPDHIFFSSEDNGALDAVVDIAGHEYSHAVIRWTSELDGCKESGAINEGLADIFGLGSEAYTNGGTHNWTIGEDANWITRNMQTPANDGNPREYMGVLYLNTDSACNCGRDRSRCYKHTNCGVIGRWFYLLTEGGANSGYGCSPVTGITLAKAEAIVHLATIKHLSEKSGFAALRDATLKSTRFLFGECSFEEVQVCRAWANVNVGGCCECIGTAEVPYCWPELLPEEGVPFNLRNKFDSKFDDLYAYPNPVGDNLIVSINSIKGTPEIYEYSVYDAHGIVVYHSMSDNSSNQCSINTSSFISGVYFLLVSTHQGIVHLKFMKP